MALLEVFGCLTACLMDGLSSSVGALLRFLPTQKSVVRPSGPGAILPGWPPGGRVQPGGVDLPVQAGRITLQAIA